MAIGDRHASQATTSCAFLLPPGTSTVCPRLGRRPRSGIGFYLCVTIILSSLKRRFPSRRGTHVSTLSSHFFSACFLRCTLTPLSSYLPNKAFSSPHSPHHLVVAPLPCAVTEVVDCSEADLSTAILCDFVYRTTTSQPHYQQLFVTIHHHEAHHFASDMPRHHGASLCTAKCAPSATCLRCHEAILAAQPHGPSGRICRRCLSTTRHVQHQ